MEKLEETKKPDEVKIEIGDILSKIKKKSEMTALSML